MPARLWPAVLGKTQAEYSARLRLASSFSPRVHLDVMDGRFVSQRSIVPSGLQKFHIPTTSRLHLMVRDPLAWLVVLRKKKIRRVILHVELGRPLVGIIKAFRRHGIGIDLAINPTTPLSKAHPYISLIRGVVIMGVKPGKYGARLRLTTFQRIRQAKKLWPHLTVGCDGGMTKQTLVRAIKAGATDIIIGSDIMLNPNPRAEWEALLRLTRAR